jgi:hypothetical protein
LAANPHSCSIDGDAPKRVAVANTLFAALELWDGDGDAVARARRPWLNRGPMMCLELDH